jgi:hypothetical protein
MSNIFEKSSPEFIAGQNATVWGIQVPSCLLAVPPLLSPSPPGEISPVRDIDVMGLCNFFDHSSDLIVSSVAATGVGYAGLAIERFVPEDKKPILIGAIGLGSMVAGAGTVAAYEANMVVPKPEATQEFEPTDTLYGGVAGVLFGLTFCVAAGVRRIKINRHKQSE